MYTRVSWCFVGGGGWCGYLVILSTSRDTKVVKSSASIFGRFISVPTPDVRFFYQAGKLEGKALGPEIPQF